MVKQAAWIAADFGARQPERIGESLKGEQTVPILDLYSSRGVSTPARSASFSRSGLTFYEALAVPVPSRPEGRNAGVIANRLIGWLAPD